jgi:hypothetical protein
MKIILLDHQIKEDTFGKAHGRHGELRNTRFPLENVNVRDKFEDTGLVRRIIPKWVLKK